jgi:glutamate synthase domain-containing protein 2
MKNKFLLYSVLTIICVTALALYWPFASWLFIIILPVIGLGIYDLFQTHHSILRNYPVIGHMRFLLEAIRPELHQYFVESDLGGRPFNRLDRSLIYQRAKKLDDTRDPRVLIGGPACRQPYSASIFNISAMSFGSLSKNAIMALNEGAKIGNFAHNTGEGGLSEYHLKPGGDIIWQIGTGYFSCRNGDGTFNYEAFRERALLPQVKMIEIKLSQGAKPGHGGILPAAKVSAEIAAIRLVEMGKDVISPPGHSAFSTPMEMVAYIQKLRELCGGKPVGFKLCIGHPSEFVAICKAMVKTGIYADFITVDGGEGGTGAAPLEFSNSVGMPLREALVLVYDVLKGFGLKEHIKIIASGKVATGFDLVRHFAMGADLCNCARGMMMALGCIQALECNKNTCPTGVATQDDSLMRGLVITDKKVRVANFHNETVDSAVQLMGAAGIQHPDYLHRWHINRRISPKLIECYAITYPYIPTGSLLKEPYPEKYQHIMKISTENTFTPDFTEVLC